MGNDQDVLIAKLDAILAKLDQLCVTLCPPADETTPPEGTGEAPATE